MKFYEDSSAKVLAGNFAVGEPEDGIHEVKMYSGLSEAEISWILESEDDGPLSMPEGKFSGSVQVRYQDGKEQTE